MVLAGNELVSDGDEKAVRAPSGPGSELGRTCDFAIWRKFALWRLINADLWEACLEVARGKEEAAVLRLNPRARSFFLEEEFSL
jgi:hypothetical protein